MSRQRASVVLVVPDSWERALLQMEVGAHQQHTAVAVGDLASAISLPPGREPVAAVLVDAQALNGKRARMLRFLRQRHPAAALVMLGARPPAAPNGDWDAVIPWPATTGRILETLDEVTGVPAPVPVRAAVPRALTA